MRIYRAIGIHVEFRVPNRVRVGRPCPAPKLERSLLLERLETSGTWGPLRQDSVSLLQNQAAATGMAQPGCLLELTVLMAAGQQGRDQGTLSPWSFCVGPSGPPNPQCRMSTHISTPGKSEDL